MPVEKTYIDIFKVRNTTNRTITLGDLVNVAIPPKQTIDLLKQPRVTKEKINQSMHLQQAVRAGWLIIIKPSTQGKTESEKKAILADESQTGIGVVGPPGPTGPGGTGSLNLSDLSDVEGNLNEQSILVYDETAAVWRTQWPVGGTITRTGDSISSIALGSGKSFTISRDGNGSISAITDGTLTWTFTRNDDNQIESWTVT